MTDIIKARVEMSGIFCRGFSFVSQFVNADPDLDIISKAIYTLICCYIGEGNIAYPGRNRICECLNIDKKTYYTYRAELEDNEYITVSYLPKAGNKYDNAVYQLNLMPPKFAKIKDKCLEKRQKSGKTIHSEDLLGLGGFGMFPKAVIYDKRLSCKEKAFLSYLWSYAGNSVSATPNKSRIKEELAISESFYLRTVKRLQDLEYVNVHRGWTLGDSQNKTFITEFFLLNIEEDIIHNPEYFVQPVDCQKRVIQKRDIQKRDTRKRFTQEAVAQKGVTQEVDINNTMVYHNHNKTKSDIINTINLSADDRYEGWKIKDFEKKIRENIDVEECSTMYPDLKPELIEELIVIMAKNCMKGKTIDSAEYSQKQVANRYLSIRGEHLMYAYESVQGAAGKIKNIPAYYANVLFRAPESIELAYMRKVKEDGAVQ